MREVELTLTNEEAAFVLNELHSAGHGHGSSKDDFEAECPSCTAADKIAVALRPAGVSVGQPAHSKSEYKRRVAMGDPNVAPPLGVEGRKP